MKTLQELEKRIIYEKMLAEISDEAVFVRDLHVFMVNALKKMGEALDVGRVFIFSYAESEALFYCIEGWDNPAVGRKSDKKPVLHIPWAAEELRAGKILNFARIENLPDEEYRNWLLSARVKSTLNVPLFKQNRFFGYIGFDEHRYNRIWKSEDLYILSTAAQTIIRVMENKQYQEEIQNHRQHLESIFSSVQDAIITVDTSLNVIEANRSAEKICGFKITHPAPFEACAVHCDRACLDLVRQTLNHKSLIREYRMECSRRNRQSMVATLTSSPLFNQNGVFLGAVLVVRDITRLSILENKLRERQHYQDIVGNSDAMQKLFTLIKNLANMSTTVLITGESGTGKEKVAQALHYGGDRQDKPFIKVNCSALAETLLESELFGHVKGAFTGAEKDSIGRFEAAEGGTLLLDEIGDISPRIQLKLLRVLQEREFERVGENRSRKMNVRILAATNKNLRKAIADGGFRSDLYYRLNVINIEVPPLRERSDDIPLFVEYFCNAFNKKYAKNIHGVSPDVLALFGIYAWPGNVRELEHTLERAFVLCARDIITREDLPPEISGAQAHPTGKAPSHDSHSRDVVMAALERAGWNLSKAARHLGVSRWTLYRRIAAFGIQQPKDR